ncbi:hypothetical protein JCM6882_003584 [Rhodosporidiobolus microsporus]
MYISRSAPVSWKIPAVQSAYQNAMSECHRQVGDDFESYAAFRRWVVDGDRLKLNEALSRLMQKELRAGGHRDLAERFSSPVVADHRQKERAAGAGPWAPHAVQAQTQAQAQIGAENPHVAVTRNAPLQQPVLRAPSAEVNPPPDDEFASYSYRGRRSPPYSHVNPQDLYRQS